MRIMGLSKGGNDVAYWVNPRSKQWIRYGYDGTNPVSDVHSMQAFFANHLTWVIGKDTPVFSEGGHGVWNNRFKEAIMTFRGHKSVEGWDETADYQTDDEVSSATVIPSQYRFYQPYQIYKAKTNVPAGTLLTDTDYWTVILRSDKNYYSEFTAVFSEIKNKFQPFQSCVPNIYMPFDDTYLSPSPIVTGQIYVHDDGNIQQWYASGAYAQQEVGYIIPVFNAPKDTIKSFAALRVDSDVVPYSVEFTSDNGYTINDSTDFETREGFHDCPIQDDMTVTDDPTADGGTMYGKYLTVKIYAPALVYQRIADVILKIRIRARDYNS